MGILTYRVDDDADLEPAARAAVDAAWRGGQGVALVLSQQFLGAKPF